ncbi:MAG: acyl-CoA dehydratase activase [Desulfovibrio sp.]|jgi:predicted CoA-substrate-specific enzyme activase|nr:acyl-CoA dehydratase activase [Desulfovibrio sp.]
MYTLGIDIGSASSKAVILEDGQKTVAAAAVQSGTGTSGPGRVLEEVFALSGLSREDMDRVIATGYGRFSVQEADRQISEITCHGKGIFFVCPSARTIIDIGGQDAKAISLDEDGNIEKFFMNDKCAAGTGRFLEVMSRVLEVELNEMGAHHFKSENPARVSSTCAVFAESEVISLLSMGALKDDIIAGVHRSVASKSCALAYRADVKDDVVMCGGVARNAGVVDAIEKELGCRITVAPAPQLTGALGAALIAFEDLKKSREYNEYGRHERQGTAGALFSQA